jgi:hypothetical protein
MGAWKTATEAAPMRGVVGRAGSTCVFDLDRWAPSDAAAPVCRAVLVGQLGPAGTGSVRQHGHHVPSLHITHERGDDGPRHGFPLPNTLVHGVVGRVFHTTISERGRVVVARFRPGGFTARFGRDAAALTGRVQPVDNELFGGPIHLDDDVDAASARLDELVGDYAGELDPTYVSLTQLVDRIRDDDRLHRVEQVMQHSPWSACTTQRVFRRYVGCRSSGCCAATAYSRQHWRSRATLASTSPTSPSASAGTTRHTSSTTSAPCWAVLRAVMP